MRVFYCNYFLGLIRSLVVVAFLATVTGGAVFADPTPVTYYSYIGLQNSSWSNPDTWTTTPGGVDSENPAVPGNGDIVHIVGNRNVILTGNVATEGLRISIEAGSTLTIGGFEFTETIVELSGEGRIRIAHSFFPDVTTNSFVADGGGTVEFYDFSGLLPGNQGEYFDLVLNSTDNNDNIFTLNHDLLVRGNLQLLRTATSGSTRLTIGNSADARELLVDGNLLVGENTSLRTGLFNAVHSIVISGNMVNNGSVVLSNSPQYTVANNGAAVVTFTGETNNSITGTGTTLDFYRLIVDKGTDPTFILDVNPVAFRLFYVTNLGNTGTGDNPEINKALWIRNGTLRLGPNVNIPVLSEGGSDFFIPLNGALWINGATVSSTSTTGGAGDTGLTVIGRFRITSGTYNGNKSAGIVFRGSAEILIEGGTVNISQFRRSIAGGLQVASYTQTGGTVNVGGGGQTNNSFARFALHESTHTFNMSGGTINILSPTDAGAFSVGSGPGYHNVTGGTISITIPAGNDDVSFCSAAPVFNLNIFKNGTGTGGLSLDDISSIGARPLVVNNNLSLGSNARLLANGLDVSVAGNFTLEAGASYLHGGNTTRFFWNSSANNGGTTIINNSGTVPLELNNVKIAKSDAINDYNTAKTVVFPGNGSPYGTDILGSLSFASGYQTLDLADAGLRVRGDIGVSRPSRIVNDMGGIFLQPADPLPQILSIGLLASNNNFILDNSGGARLVQDSHMESLTITSGELYIGSRRLTLNQPVIDGNLSGFSGGKMVSTNGLTGTLRYRFSGVGPGTYLFPAGSGRAVPPGEEPYVFSEFFDGGGPELPAGWTQDEVTGDTEWTVHPDGYARFLKEANGHSSRLKTPALNLGGYSSVTINFREYRNRDGGQNDQLFVEYSLDDDNWTIVGSFTAQADPPVTRSVTLPPAALEDGVIIGFLAVGSARATQTRIFFAEVTNLVGAEKYTPFTLTLSGEGSFPAGDNFVSVTPVNSVHPNVEPGKEDDALLYYWNVSTSFPAGNPADLNSTYRFDFLDEDKIVAGGAKRGYTISGVGTPVHNGTYNEGDLYLEYVNNAFASADFSGGRPNVFNKGTVTRTFVTTGSGDWRNTGIWEMVAGAGNPRYPAAGDVAQILSEHTVTTTQAEEVRELTILSGGVLDLEGTTGHVFGDLFGDGTLRTSSGVLPEVPDHLEAFTGSYNSTIEYYGTGDIDLPSLPVTYYNILFTGTGVKSLPDADLNIRNRFSVEGAPVETSGETDGDLTVNGQLNIEGAGGVLTILSGNDRQILAANLSVGDDGVLAVENAGSGNHLLTITGGGIDVNSTGSIDLRGNGSNVCDVLLTGPGHADISGADADIRLNRLVVDKDGGLADHVTVTAPLSIEGPSGGADKALELLRGTFIIETGGATGVDITLSSGGDPFNIPATAALIVRGEPGTPNTVRISGGSGMLLDGLFRLAGNARALFNDGENYIQYSSSGNARIEVTGLALLNLGGQLRRSVSESSGILGYYQVGGEVYIASVNATQGNRGVFEILNPGSSFTHTGGVLSIGRSSGNPGGDIFLEPSSFNIGAGATLTIDALAGSQNIRLRSAIPLGNLNITGNNSPLVTLQTHPLVLNGDFSTGSEAEFIANSLDQTYRGNFTNSGDFDAGTSTSFFMGGSQTITGETEFYNLYIEPSVAVTLADDIIAGRNLVLLSGVFDDGGNFADVKNHLFNNAEHVSPDPDNGGIRLSGNAEQRIATYTESAPTTAVGIFGRMILDNTAGARMMNRFNLTGHLILVNGVFNIQNRLLSLGVNSNILGGPFDVTRMIRSGGDMGDQGVRKSFDSSVSGFGFTFPIGVAGKYTPLTISNVTLAPDCCIQVFPVNNPHPSINPVSGGDPGRVLQYYWDVSGDMTGFTGDLVFTYVNSDALGNQDEYYTAHLKPSNDTWAKLSEGVDPVANTISFLFDNVSPDDFTGFFTAGEDDAIPDEIAVYTAIESGGWDVDDNWDQVTSPPNGIIVDIPQGIAIDIESDRKRLYRTRIGGLLDISSTTTFHNLGIVSGTGTLSLNNDFLPPGDYDSFFACDGGTIEYGGPGPYTITNRYLDMNNVIISGSGVKKFPNNNVNLCGNLDITGTATLELFPQRNLNIMGNMTKEAGAGFTGNLECRVIFSGTSGQWLTGNFTGSNRFCEFQVNNAGLLEITGQAEVANNLYLTSGVVSTVEPLILSNPDGLMEYSASSYIRGPFRRLLSDDAGTRFFPVGKGGLYKLTALIDPSVDGEYWTVEYFRANPGNQENLSDIETVGFVEYWEADGPAGGEARLQLSLTGSSDVAAALESDDRLGDLVIAGWNPVSSSWELVGGGADVTGTAGNGTITTDDPVVLADYDRFTLASVTVVPIITAWIISGDETICYDDTYELEIGLAGGTEYDFSYEINSTVYPVVDFSGSTFTVLLTAGVELEEGLNVISLESVTGDGTPGIVFGDPVTVTVVEQPGMVDVVSNSPVCVNTPVVIEVENVEHGFTYLLYEDDEFTGLQEFGDDGDITFLPGVKTVAGTYLYEVRAYRTGFPQCWTDVGNTTVEVLDAPEASITLDPEVLACEDDPLTINVVFAGGSGTYSFRIIRVHEDGGMQVEVEVADVTDHVGDYTLVTTCPGWIDSGARPAEATTYTYTLVDFADGAGCAGTVAEDALLDVWKRPETGPQYHIPNIFGQ